MKDKRILAMFVTSCVALVASVVITLGVALTLADPVPVTDVLRVSFNLGATNSAEITGTYEDALVYENAIVLQPSGSIHVENWDPDTMNTDGKVGSPLYLDDVHPTYESELKYENESLPSKVEFVTIRVTNSTAEAQNIAVDTIHNTSSNLGKYIKTVVFDCETYGYYSYDDTNLIAQKPEFEIAAGESRDFILMVYVDELDNYTDDMIAYGTEKENVSVVIRNLAD